ncbi:MAG: hypothetical protein AVDCRST_MAG59-3996, partial [uncultured Thermomicrobiales bacterium]
ADDRPVGRSDLHRDQPGHRGQVRRRAAPDAGRLRADPAAGLAHLRDRPDHPAPGRGVQVPQVVHARPPAVLRGQGQVRPHDAG